MAAKARRRAFAVLCVGGLLLAPLAASGQITPGQREEITIEDDMVQLDFNDVGLSVVIDTIARLTGRNFIYDDRVRGRVTIVSPSKISVEQAYAVFESVLQVKGFTTVTTPGGVIKVIPIREAKESNIETLRGRRATPDSDRFVTRLIPLRFIDAEAITATLKPLVSKDAAMVAYAPTNTVILTDSASNIRRILAILDSIDVETYKEELAVIKVRHADASTMAQQLSEIFGAEVTGVSPAQARRTRARRAGTPQAAQAAAQAGGPLGGTVRILTDERTNSLLVLASRPRLADIREVVAKLDVPVTGGGRIHVYYLKHADAEELASTLSSLVSGQSAAPGAGGRAAAQATPQALRAAITELAEGVSVTADPPTNSLVIQASQEGFNTLSEVIALLDIQRPQVLVEALIMEVLVSDKESLGFDFLTEILSDNRSVVLGSLTGTAGLGIEGDAIATDLGNFIGSLSRDNRRDTDNDGTNDAGTLIQSVLAASASDGRTNVVSAPHILTSDNEEAEIKVGDNIPIITSRVQSASTAAAVNEGTQATSVNVERQDIGVTLRVTPQISEGDSVRLQIFQEITNINTTLSTGEGGVGDPSQVGVALTNRQVENTVVVNDRETVVIGGLISDDYNDRITKIPWLGDIPILGWAFKSTSRELTKRNLLIFLTPHIVRTDADLEQDTIRKREEYWERSEEGLRLSDREQKESDERRAAAEAAGLPVQPYKGRNPVRARLLGHSERYPVERMLEIEKKAQENAERARQAAQAAADAPGYGVLAAVFRDDAAAADLLTELVDAGYDGTLVASESQGTVMMELRLGPYASLEEAEAVADAVRQSFGLVPTVFVERGEE